MDGSKRITTYIAVISLVVMSGCSMNTTTVRSHPALEQQLEHVKEVVILPPRVEIEFLTFTGDNERMTEKEKEISGELMEIARRKLSRRGYEIIPFDFDSVIASDEDFAYTITQVREGFEKAKSDLKLGKKVPEREAKRIRASVGEAVNAVAAKTGADAVFLMRYTGFDKSGGQVAKDVGTTLVVGILTMGVLIPVSATSGAVSEAALIDGLTGDVLWANIRFGGLDSGITERLMESCPKDSDPDTE